MQIEGIRVGLVNSHLLVRSAMRCLLQGRGVQVIAEAGNAAEARALLAAEQPDVALMDVELGGESVLPLISELLAISARTRILIVTASQDARLHCDAIEGGAAGLVLTDQSPDILMKAIEKVHLGEVWIDRALTAGVLSRLTRRRPDVDPEKVKIQTLTRREREVVVLVGEGLKNRHIADRLFISEATVRNHLTSILDKLDLGDRFELAVYAFRHGLVSYPQPAMSDAAPLFAVK